MAWYFDRNSGASVSATGLSAALGDVSDGEYTIAALVYSVDTTIGYQAFVYLQRGGTAYSGFSLNPAQQPMTDTVLFFDAASFTLNDATPYLLVLSVAAGTGASRWCAIDLAVGGDQTNTFSAGAVGGPTADEVLIGAWQGSDYLGGYEGLLAVWEGGGMTYAQMQALAANKRTSDLWNSSFGPPVSLVEMTVDPTFGSPVDLAGGISSFYSYAAYDDTNDPFTAAGWSYDGYGSGPGTQNITGAGDVATAYVSGSPTVSTAGVTLTPSGVGSLEAHGSPKLNMNITAAGAQASLETHGTPLVSAGGVILTPSGAASLEASGTPRLGHGLLAAGGTPSGEAHGTPAITTGPVTISPTGTPSAEAGGQATLSGGSVVIAPRQLPTLRVG